MEVSCKEICRCCKTCKGCLGFQKILESKNTGLVIFRHINCVDEVNRTTGLLQNSTNTMDDIFIIHNTKDTQIRADECITEIDQSISCARCRELLKRAKKCLQNISPIEKKDVISVCDHCKQNKMKKRALRYCCKCHEILKKYNSEQVKQSTAKEQIKTWLSNIHKILENVKRTKTTLKKRSYSELYLKSISQTAFTTPRHLEVEPMLEKGVTISLRGIREYYSQESLIYSTAGLTDYDENKNFSYVFPKEARDEILPLRRVKTSAELIVDTQIMLRQRADDKIRQQAHLLAAKKGQSREKKAVVCDDEDGKSRSTEKKSVDSEIVHRKKSDKPSSKKGQDDIKEDITNMKKVQKDQKTQKEVVGRGTKDKQVMEEKEESQKLKQVLRNISADKPSSKKRETDIKEDKNDKELKQKLKDQQTVKEEKTKNKNEKDNKPDKLQKPEEDVHVGNLKKMMYEQAKEKRELLKSKKERDEDYHKQNMKADEKVKERAELESKPLKENLLINDEKETDPEKPKPDKKQKVPTTKELNIKQIKIRRPSPDDLILQLVSLRRSSKKDEVTKPQRLPENNNNQQQKHTHKTHKDNEVLKSLRQDSGSSEVAFESIINPKPTTGKTDIIVGNKIVKSKLPLNEKILTEEMVPILYKSLSYNEDITPAHRAENITNRNDRNLPQSHNYVSANDPPRFRSGLILRFLSEPPLMFKCTNSTVMCNEFSDSKYSTL